MLRFVFSFFLLLSLFIPKVYSQNSKTISLVWEQKDMLDNSQFLSSDLSFKDAFFNHDSPKTPIIKRKIRLPENISSVKINISILDSIPLSSKEKLMLDSLTLPEALTWSISYERKIPFLILSYLPITSSHKITKFEYHLNLKYVEYELNNSKKSSLNSVLSDGDWFRFKVSDDGL